MDFFSVASIGRQRCLTPARSPAEKPSKVVARSAASGSGVEMLSYFEYNDIHESLRRFPGLRVTVLPKPDNWPTRPEGGFKSNTEGFDKEYRC